MNEELRISPQQNRILLALTGKPLLSEFFSDSLEISNTVRKTILASSFDKTDVSSNQIDQSDVKRFLDEVLRTKVHTLKDEKWGFQLSGGTYSIDTNMTKDSDDRLMSLTTLNRSHPALIGI
jgi:hypothetical protein